MTFEQNLGQTMKVQLYVYCVPIKELTEINARRKNNAFVQNQDNALS